MFEALADAVYATYVIFFGIPSNVMLSIVGAAAELRPLYGAMGHCIYRHDVRGGLKSLYVLRMLVGITEERAFAGNIALAPTYWFPGISAPARQRIIMIAMPATTALGSDCLRHILSLDVFEIMDGSGYSCWKDFRPDFC